LAFHWCVGVLGVPLHIGWLGSCAVNVSLSGAAVTDCSSVLQKLKYISPPILQKICQDVYY
jgi:hypothetical protein